jgi:hypothetical protein
MPAVTKIREDETALKKERVLIGGEWVDSTLGEWPESRSLLRRLQRKWHRPRVLA